MADQDVSPPVLIHCISIQDSKGRALLPVQQRVSTQVGMANQYVSSQQGIRSTANPPIYTQGRANPNIRPAIIREFYKVCSTICPFENKNAPFKSF